MEQDAAALPPPVGDIPPAPGGDVPPAPGGDVPPAPDAGAEPQPVDVNNDPDVEKVDSEGDSKDKGTDESGTEELDITDLVDSQKQISQKQDDYFEEFYNVIHVYLNINTHSIVS